MDGPGSPTKRWLRPPASMTSRVPCRTSRRSRWDSSIGLLLPEPLRLVGFPQYLALSAVETRGAAARAGAPLRRTSISGGRPELYRLCCEASEHRQRLLPLRRWKGFVERGELRRGEREVERGAVLAQVLGARRFGNGDDPRLVQDP